MGRACGAYGEDRGVHRVNEVKETRGYWKWKEEALDRIVGRTRFGRSYVT